MWTLLSPLALTLCLLVVGHAVPLPTRMTRPRGPGRPAALSPRSARPEIDMVIHEASIKAGERASRPGASPRREPRVMEMDMKLTDIQMAALHQPQLAKGGPPVARIAISDEAFRWTGAIIPYEFAPDVFTTAHQAMIRDAMDEWEKYTCVSFVPRGSGQNNYVSIISGYGCWSEVGMITGKQEMSIDIYGCLYTSTIIHELGHTIGFHHEQTRPDRDNHVQITEANIQSGLEYNFDKYTWDFVKDYGIKYDHASIMHYSSWAFTRNGKRTIVTIEPKYQDLIGTVPGPSIKDIQTVMLMYRCAASCDRSRINCPADAILNSRCECWCNTGNPADPVVIWDGSSDCKSANDYTDPCVDFYPDCAARTAAGECDSNPTSMLVDCRRSCNICGPNPICKDYNTQCEGWSLRGECESNPSWMNRNCRKSCGACGSTTQPGVCADQVALCATYASSGDCEQYRDSMLERCPQSCKACLNTPEFECRNWHVECPKWAEFGQCNEEPEYMKLHCPRACGLCSGGNVPDCKNYAADTDCDRWAGEGECATNPSWMLFTCAKSCRSCGSDKVCLDRRYECAGWKDYCNTTVDGPSMYFYCPVTCGHCTPAPGTHKPSCQNYSPQCQAWKDEGRCHSNPDLMLWSCPSACKICGSDTVCDNFHATCESWASTGECQANPGWMLKVCAKACDACDGSGTITTTPTTTTTTTPTTTTTTTPTTTTTITTTTTTPTSTTTLPDEEGCTDYSGTENCVFALDQDYTCDDGADWMPFYCAKTCRNCGSNALCKNYNPSCEYWASTNQCVANPGYMLVFCRAACTPSCQTAPTTTTTAPTTTTVSTDIDKERCTDYYVDDCENRASQGDCETDTSFMFPNCPNTCKVCGPGSDCKDYHNSCSSWAAYNECTKNPGYMRLHCRKACQICT